MEVFIKLAEHLQDGQGSVLHPFGLHVCSGSITGLHLLYTLEQKKHWNINGRYIVTAHSVILSTLTADSQQARG